jgi:hypothetical protein
MADAAHVQVRGGRLHIPSAIYDRLLAPCPAVALLVQDGQWWLLPLHSGAGGLQVKLRNAAGDRVVEAQEFFRQQGLEDEAPAQDLELLFDAARGGFALRACWPSHSETTSGLPTLVQAPPVSK